MFALAIGLSAAAVTATLFLVGLFAGISGAVFWVITSVCYLFTGFYLACLSSAFAGGHIVGFNYFSVTNIFLRIVDTVLWIVLWPILALAQLSPLGEAYVLCSILRLRKKEMLQEMKDALASGKTEGEIRKQYEGLREDFISKMIEKAGRDE